MSGILLFFFLHWHRVLTCIKFHTLEFLNCWESNRSFLGKQQRLFREIIFCKKCIRGLIPKSLPVPSTEPWLRNEDPSLHSKLLLLPVDRADTVFDKLGGRLFLLVCLMMESVDSTGREIGYYTRDIHVHN